MQCLRRYLATGDAQQTIAFSYRLGKTTVHNIVKETCCAIWNVIGPQYLLVPKTEADWKLKAREFCDIWNFPNPNCLSAIDGKHVVIQSPPNSGSEFFNYKGTYSVVLLAACDARYCFTVVDVGASGRESDGGVFANSQFNTALRNNSLQMPVAEKLPGTNISAPYVIVADNAFPLRTNLMKPFAGRNLPYRESVFNYRLSRARRVIENTFGILATRWRIFRRQIIAKPDLVVKIVQATCVLHNYLQKANNEQPQYANTYCPGDLVDIYNSDGSVIPGSWREEGHGNLLPRTVHVNRYSQEAADVRELFANYFLSSEGAVPWQRASVLSCGPLSVTSHHSPAVTEVTQST